MDRVNDDVETVERLCILEIHQMPEWQEQKSDG